MVAARLIGPELREQGRPMSEAPSAGPNTGNNPPSEPRPIRLRDALHKARIEAADRTGVVVDLRDAEVARLEILNDALDPLFTQVPDTIDLFERGISNGETPRLWIDVVAHVVMGRDKRIYRFVQDTRYGRIVLAESHDVPVIVDAVTDYVARRLVQREHLLPGQLHGHRPEVDAEAERRDDDQVPPQRDQVGVGRVQLPAAA